MTGYKLDADLVREIIVALGDGRMPETDLSEKELRHHYRVLFHAGFINTDVTPNVSYDYLIMNSATVDQLFEPLTGNDPWFYLAWEGNEFLRNIQDDNLWSKAKLIMNNVGSVGLQLVVQAAAQVAATEISGAI